MLPFQAPDLESFFVNYSLLLIVRFDRLETAQIVSVCGYNLKFHVLRNKKAPADFKRERFP